MSCCPEPIVPAGCAPALVGCFAALLAMLLEEALQRLPAHRAKVMLRSDRTQPRDVRLLKSGLAIGKGLNLSIVVEDG